MSAVPHIYAAQVLRWIDGDTVDLRVDLGFGVSVTERFRLAGIDTPEKTHPLGPVATTRCRQLAPEGSTLTTRTHRPDTLWAADDQEKYGRWLADLILPDGQDVADTLVHEGLAHIYDGTGPRPPWPLPTPPETP